MEIEESRSTTSPVEIEIEIEIGIWFQGSLQGKRIMFKEQFSD